MSALEKSGRSDAWNQWFLSVCFRPKADVHGISQNNYLMLSDFAPGPILRRRTTVLLLSSSSAFDKQSRLHNCVGSAVAALRL